MNEKEKMITGKLYNPFDPELIEMRRSARELTDQFNSTPSSEVEKRVKIIKQLFGETGKEVLIEPSFRCDYGWNIFVGENFFMNFDCVILDGCEVRFGDNCMVGPQVGIYTATHPVDPELRKKMLEFGKPVTIGHNCWIGGMACIKPGITLGSNVVVAAGTVVTKSFGDNVVIGGNPARVISSL